MVKIICYKARQDVEFYNQGKVQLGKTNITRDIAVQPYFYFTFLTQALNCLNRLKLSLFLSAAKKMAIIMSLLCLFVRKCSVLTADRTAREAAIYCVPNFCKFGYADWVYFVKL